MKGKTQTSIGIRSTKLKFPALVQNKKSVPKACYSQSAKKTVNSFRYSNIHKTDARVSSLGGDHTTTVDCGVSTIRLDCVAGYVQCACML